MYSLSTRVKAKYVFLAFVPYLIFYFLIQSAITTNHYDLLTFLDAKIPFIPQFIWIYHTIIPVTVITSFILFQKRELFLSLTYANLLAGTILCLFYILFPSFYPREGFVDTTTISGLFVEFTRAIDGAHNTFPSGHVTFSWLLTFFVGLSQKGRQCSIFRVLYFCWAILISISTLTLKQHFLIDVVCGILLARIIFLIFRNMFSANSQRNLITIDADFIPPRTSTKEVPIDC